MELHSKAIEKNVVSRKLKISDTTALFETVSYLHSKNRLKEKYLFLCFNCYFRFISAFAFVSGSKASPCNSGI